MVDLSDVVETQEESTGAAGRRAGDDLPGLGRPRLDRAGVPQHLRRRDVEPRLPDDLSPPQRAARRRVRARVPARARRSRGNAADLDAAAVAGVAAPAHRFPADRLSGDLWRAARQRLCSGWVAW